MANEKAAEAGVAWARDFTIVVPYDPQVLQAAREWSAANGNVARDVRVFTFAAVREIERRRGAGK